MKGTILERIIEAKRLQIATAKQNFDRTAIVRKAHPYRLRKALSDRSKHNIIAEFKRASPSKGIINDSVSPALAAANYRDAGAAAISVLTEEHFFKGSIDDLRAVRNAVDLPILRKDFIIDEFHIHESAAIGADAILLIVAALRVNELRHFCSLSDELGLDALVEVHDLAEMEVAAEIGAMLIGVNNRNLKTFEVSLDVSRELIKYAPPGAIMIAESGISSRDEIAELSGLGYSGFLVGESLMRSGDATSALKAWL